MDSPYVARCLLMYVSLFPLSGIPKGIHLIARLRCSALRLAPTMASADFSQFVVTTAFVPPVRPHGISRQSFLVYLPDLRLWVTVAFWTLLSFASLSAKDALYQVSVRQATISLSLLLACTSQYKPWESLWGSSATTPLVDFHHRLTACPSYQKKNCQKTVLFPGFITNLF